MVKYLIALIFVPIVAMATMSSEKEFALNRLSGVARKYDLGTELAKRKNHVVGKYSYAVQGGSSVASVYLLRDLTDTSSRVVIPDNAIITNVYWDGLTAVTGGSVSVGVNSGSDLKTAVGGSGSTGILAGVPLAGSVATAIKLSADKTAFVRITNGNVTAGKFNVYIEYALGD